MPGLVPGIHVFTPSQQQAVDARVKAMTARRHIELILGVSSLSLASLDRHPA
jgi:hypothetical protein